MLNLDLYLSVFFAVGVLVVLTYAWQRFNEPSFPNRKTLPRTLVPVRYLFLRSSYRRARLAYVGAILLLYCTLVAPGPKIAPFLSTTANKEFPPEGWALLAAVILTGFGLVPDSFRWLNKVENQIRQWVHEWFLVPDGVERTIGILEDAPYELPASQFKLVEISDKERLQQDLKSASGTPLSRWGRATALITSLQQKGAQYPLKGATLEPFAEDFEIILEKYEALRPDVEALRGNQVGTPKLTKSINDLLGRIYAYISWGVRSQSSSEKEIDQTLEKLGFTISQEPAARPLFDIVLPAVLLVAFVTMIFWVSVDAVKSVIGGPVFVIQESIVHSLSPAFAAGLMYGTVVFIALKYRSIKIDNRVWRENSAISLIGIALRAGFVTWAVIMVTTFLFECPTATWQWWVDHASFVTSYFGGHESDSLAWPGWGFLPVKMATALPWLLVGATASAVLASCAGGDVRIDKPHRLMDAIILGIAVGLAAATAQLIQTSLSQFQFQEADAPSLAIVPVIGLAGAICGGVIGFMVPQAYRANLVRPHNREMDKTLRDLLRKAEAQLMTRAAAEEWVFGPNDALGGIAPAEAVQYQTQSNLVETLLAQENSPRPPKAGGTYGNVLGAPPVPVDPGILHSPGLVPAIVPSDPCAAPSHALVTKH
jgi:hypothetical protein